MKLVDFFIILFGVLLNALAQLSLKAGTNSLVTLLSDKGFLYSIFRIIFQPYILLGLGLYVVSVGTWIVALSRVQVSLAYPLLSIGYIITAVIAWLVFKEPMTVTKVTGILVIIIGVCILTR
jgi:multidrug transporter EmrE-like cation transporter